MILACTGETREDVSSKLNVDVDVAHQSRGEVNDKNEI